MGLAGKTSSFADLKSLLPFITTNRRTKTFAYTFVVAFIVCTAFLTLSSSTNAFNTIFAPSSIARSQVSSLVLYLFPNSSSSAAMPEIQNTVQKPAEDTELRVGSSGNVPMSVKNETTKESGIDFQGGLMKNQTAVVIGPKNGVSAGKNQNDMVERTELPKNEVPVTNQAGSQETRLPTQKNETVKKIVPTKNQTGIQETRTPAKKNGTVEGTESLEKGDAMKNQAGSKDSRTTVQKNGTVEGRGSPKNGAPAKNQTDSAVKIGELQKKAPSPSPASSNGGQKNENLMDKLMGCDIFDGRWVHDDSYPLYPPGSCPHIDEQFDCHRNGRPDEAYLKYRWQPNCCDIPRLNASDMLERLRGRRLVFVGDSLNRNMWESLVCALRNSLKDKTKVFEASGKQEFRTEGAYSFVFKDYGCSVEFFQSPFLVQEWKMPNKNGSNRETLRLDVVDKLNSRYKDAYVIIFNTGHWWTHEKTSQGKDYYQEGNHVYDVLNVDEAFHKALNTWARWVDTNVNLKRSLVFFRGYSASHFSGGQWNSGGQCDRETDPIDNDKYLSRYPQKMNILEDVIKGMRTPVAYMNITRMTDYRKDGHPSFYRKLNTTVEERAPDMIQDCSHWCLPGVPDAWNELLYAQLLIEQHRMQH